ncbi:MAG TPA: beta-ribofuranosylaminobenzene 5'-phosphate synthase family protein [Gemmatimonadaceae bacterium]|nr:beta-ribofuranosylaminobenzene 5'-phosphate synthase family protein [Gemmatimonadaceae bacterium]
MSGTAEEAVAFVEAPARLHFGMLDLRGDLGRRFGGIGAAVPSPSLLVEVASAPPGVFEGSGPEADRALDFARRYLAHEGIDGGASVHVHRAIPAHAGLGSGTQLALAVARALATLHGRPEEPTALARAVERARRSAIGTYTFAAGGLVVEGGRRDGADAPAPLIARLAVPAAWHCVVAVPRGQPGVSGEAEAAAFAALPAPPRAEVERVAHVVLLRLLPSVAEGDVAGFGAALTEVQEVTGRWWAPVQGGTYAPGATESVVRAMRAWGALGVGQSSWGPAAYAVVEGAAAGAALAREVRSAVGEGGRVFEGPFASEGARVWRAPRRRAPSR